MTQITFIDTDESTGTVILQVPFPVPTEVSIALRKLKNERDYWEGKATETAEQYDDIIEQLNTVRQESHKRKYKLRKMDDFARCVFEGLNAIIRDTKAGLGPNADETPTLNQLTELKDKLSKCLD